MFDGGKKNLVEVVPVELLVLKFTLIVLVNLLRLQG